MRVSRIVRRHPDGSMPLSFVRLGLGVAPPLLPNLGSGLGASPGQWQMAIIFFFFESMDKGELSHFFLFLTF